VRDYPAPAENNLFASSTDLQAGAAAAIRTLAANGNVTATEQLPQATQPTNKCARWLACASVAPMSIGARF
jgi:hypothetical protein